MAFVSPNDPVAKGPVTYCLDAISVREDARAGFESLRKALIGLEKRNYRGLEKVFERHLFRDFYNKSQTKRITDYLKKYWFDEKTGWWPAFQPIAPIYAVGLINALNVSLSAKTPLPIDSYWITGHDKVEMITLANDRQVTLLIATPSPIELAPRGIWSETSSAWVTGRRAGASQHEVDPARGDRRVKSNPDLRVRTFKIQSHMPKKP